MAGGGPTEFTAVYSIKKILRSERASEIAEAALVLPIAFMILLGIYWFGRALNTYATINHAAREGARVAVVQTCGACASPNQGTPNSTVATAVTNALQASGVDPTPIKFYQPTLTFCSGTQASNCLASGANGNVNICTNVLLQDASSTTGMGAPACGVAVAFQYPYTFWVLPLSSLSHQQITLTADVQMAGEY